MDVHDSFTANPLFGPLLAALRPSAAIRAGEHLAGTVGGADVLVSGAFPDATPDATRALPVAPVGGIALDGYRAAWRRLAAQDGGQACSSASTSERPRSNRF